MRRPWADECATGGSSASAVVSLGAANTSQRGHGPRACLEHITVRCIGTTPLNPPLAKGEENVGRYA